MVHLTWPLAMTSAPKAATIWGPDASTKGQKTSALPSGWHEALACGDFPYQQIVVRTHEEHWENFEPPSWSSNVAKPYRAFQMITAKSQLDATKSNSQFQDRVVDSGRSPS
jgi:hypothetical protein